MFQDAVTAPMLETSSMGIMMSTSKSATSTSSSPSPAQSFDREYQLPNDFVPGPMDVVCARGKGCGKYLGNIRFRQIVECAMTKYASTDSRLEKTLIVSEIVETIRNSSSSNVGGFVKKEKGNWYTVDDTKAREKVSQSLRDMLSMKYKSSNKNKKRRRRELNQKINQELDNMVQTNTIVSQRIKQLSTDIQAVQEQKQNQQQVLQEQQQQQPKYDAATTVPQQHRSTTPAPTAATASTESSSSTTQSDDELMSQLFNQANMDLLEALKRDATVITNFNTIYSQQESSSSNSSVVSDSDHDEGDLLLLDGIGSDCFVSE